MWKTMEEIVCEICDYKTNTYRGLTNHINWKHPNITTKEYYDKFIGKTYCLVCGHETQYKGLKIGYRQFCSNKCSNSHKAKDINYLKKLSDSQKNIPRKKHSECTKKLISLNSKKQWCNPETRKKHLDALRSDVVRGKISKSICEYGYHKYISYINGIRCESKTEEKFVQKCINENIKIERFHNDGEKSIKIKNNWRLPDFLLDNVIIDVKDFHIWFKKELFTGLDKYHNISNWCNQNDYIFLFWFEKYGYKTIEDMLKIKNQDDLNLFIKNHNKQ